MAERSEPVSGKTGASEAKELSDDVLMASLFTIQQEIRALLAKHGIPPGGFQNMAREARRLIPQARARTEFLGLLADLGEFAVEAKRRGLLDEAALTVGGVQTEAATKATAKRQAAVDADLVRVAQEVTDGEHSPIDDQVARDFFERLDALSRESDDKTDD